MAFTVTPTSGVGPYTYEVDIADRFALDQGLYSPHFYYSTNEGSCLPPELDSQDYQVTAQALATAGIYQSLLNNVPAGSCRVSIFALREVATGNVVSSSTVSIDNV